MSKTHNISYTDKSGSDSEEKFSILYNKYKNKPSSIFFYGGGAFNKLMVQGIIDLTKLRKVKSMRYGIHEKNFEATAFSWLALMRLNGVKFAKSSITGSKKSYYLGNIY